MKKVLVLLLLFSVSIFAQDDSNKLTVYDFLILTQISSPQFSPDGQTIACVIGKKETWDKSRINNIWLIKSDSEKTQLTNSEKPDWNPQWSPDGTKIAFLSTRSGKTQVYCIPIDGGEAQRKTWSKESVAMFDWIDNDRIAYVTNSPRDSILVETEKEAGGGFVVGTITRKSELWIQSINKKSENIKIVGDKFYIADMESSTDGKTYALIIAPDSDFYNMFVSGEILVIDDNGNKIFSYNKAKMFHDIDFSPNDKKISFVGNTVGFSSNNALFVTDLTSKETVNLTEEFDPTIGSVEWLDNNNLTFNTPRNVYTGIYQVSLNSKVNPILSPYWVLNSYAVDSKNKEIAFIGNRSQTPSELYSLKFKEKPDKAVRLTNENKSLRDKKSASSKVVKFPSFESETIEAVVTFPPDYPQKGKYPLMVLPHGGPDGIVMDSFSLFGQLFALEGFIVYQPHFRGGIGYGSEFYAANRGKLGDIDYKDIMAGLDYLIKTEKVDEEKLVVGGWSYGGYMTNWIIGHSNRFRAAVSVAGIANTVSMYAQSDINHGEVAIWEFKGVPVLNIENFVCSSPLNFLKNCKTPTLILHGQSDTRVPVAQAWELYRALIDLGVDVEMVLYPNAGHGINAPKQFTNVFKRWADWYKKYLKN